ncbi:MAG TPA: peptidoglycan DD-metalloendopeptidase family protein [Patescibacteria group bacterium]|nr:peptidoglycan DD-metalloendopeptidase family protein [Patescibacteria group bacterium]
MQGGKRVLASITAVWMLFTPVVSYADDSTILNTVDTGTAGLKDEVDSLNSQLKQKESRVNELDATISQYKQKIAQNESAVASLQNEVGLLDNRIQEKQLATEKTREQMTIASLRIDSLNKQIEIQQATIARREDAIAEYVRQIEEADSVSLLDVFLARPSISQFFARLEELKQIEQDLTDATRQIKENQAQLEAEKKDLEQQQKDLQIRKQELEKEQTDLEQDRSAKVSLVSVTQNKEEEFQRIVYELRQEQQSMSDDISNLKDSVKDKLDSVDDALARGDVLLDWPIPVRQGISARFHDPDYPFRRFFEHPGIDLPTPVGTPIRAAAGGYVAWNKTGKQYGNYVMVIHPGGIATVYGHLSRFAAKADTYVERGDIIGYSGGQPGMPGAGLSTGPHVHFEVRQNGIPVNPENFLTSLD